MGRNIHGLAFLVASFVAVACSPDPCGNGAAIAPVALDVTGESNTACTLTVTDGDSTLTYDVAAPEPAVYDTAPDTRAPPTACTTTAVVSRTQTQICFGGDAALDDLAHGSGAACPLRVTLTCDGSVLYDVVPWNFCNEQC